MGRVGPLRLQWAATSRADTVKSRAVTVKSWPLRLQWAATSRAAVKSRAVTVESCAATLRVGHYD
eukprot:1167607-Amorphochlora_amoeboformis.AAC.1